MDLTKAWGHATNAANIMGEKSRTSGFNQSETAAGQLCLAFVALLEEMEKEPANYPVDTGEYNRLVGEANMDRGIYREPGVYSGRINPLDGGTSPFRHQQLAPAAEIVEHLTRREVI